jgi:nucleotide-binding universal stress UspA family protein
MKTRRTAPRVVVATSGSAASRAAITYAADEAASRGLPLEVVHVVPPTLPVGPYVVSPDAAARRTGREVLAHGESLAHQAHPRLDVSTTLLVGSRADAVVHHAAGAEVLVVGAPPHDLLERLWTGSTVYGVAARAACPVTIVPAGTPPPPSREVLVGLKTTHHVGHLLATAFAVAHLRQADLRVVHAWHRISPYDEAITERHLDPAFEKEQTVAIDGLLTDLRMMYPEVRVHVEVVHGQPAFALVTASKNADLLVLSRPAHGGFVHYLGATAHAVIREAACPVLVVPPVDERRGVEHLADDSVLRP